MPEIFQTLALCTAHLTKDVADDLDRVLKDKHRHDVNHWTYFIVGSPWEYGWWIWAELEAITELPESLRACLLFARQHGCRYVLFDCDVSEIEELPGYEW